MHQHCRDLKMYMLTNQGRIAAESALTACQGRQLDAQECTAGAIYRCCGGYLYALHMLCMADADGCMGRLC